MTERRNRESKHLEKIISEEFRYKPFFEEKYWVGNKKPQVESIFMAFLEHLGFIAASLIHDNPKSGAEEFAIKRLPEMINKGRIRILKEIEEEEMELKDR